MTHQASGVAPLVLRHNIDVQFNGLLEAIVLIPAPLCEADTEYIRHGAFETSLYTWFQRQAKKIPRAFARVCVHLASHVCLRSQSVASIVRPMLPDGRATVIPDWVRSVPLLVPQSRSKSAIRSCVWDA